MWLALDNDCLTHALSYVTYQDEGCVAATCSQYRAILGALLRAKGRRRLPELYFTSPFANLSRLEYALANGWTMDAQSIEKASKCGDVHVIQRLLDMGGVPTYEMLRVAAAAGNMHTLLWFHEHLENLDMGSRSWSDLVDPLALHGDADILEWLATTHGLIGVTSETVKDAVRIRDSDLCMRILRLLVQHDCPKDESAMQAAAARRDVEVMRFLYENGFPWSADVCSEAVGSGTREMLVYARDHGCPWDEGSCNAAAWNGDMESLLYLRAHGCPWDVATSAHAAMTNMEMLLYVIAEGCPVNAAALHFAAWYGNFETFSFLFDGFEEKPMDMFDTAIKNGHLAIIVYALEHGIVFGEAQCRRAAVHGRVDILRYLHEQGVEWDEDDCLWQAVRYRQLEVAKYLHEVGVEMDEDLLERAIENHDLEMAAFLLDCGCPVVGAGFRAAWEDDLDMLELLHARGVPLTVDVASSAACSYSLCVLEYVRSLGCPWDASTCAGAAEFGRLANLRYAHEHGCPWDETTFIKAIGHICILEYAHAHGCPWSANVTAAAVGHTETLQWLIERGCPWDERVLENEWARTRKPNVRCSGSGRHGSRV